MNRWPGSVFLLLLLAGLFSGEAKAEAADIPRRDGASLVEDARELDGRRVRFEGEAIGVFLPRGGHGWINLSDGTAIGVWIGTGDVPDTLRFGSYDRRGDTLRVLGVFHRACPEHGGDLDIHALHVERLKEGAELPHPVKQARLAAALLLLALAGILFPVWRRRERVARERASPGMR